MEMDGKLDFLGRAEERLGREITAAELPGTLRALREILEEYEVSRREYPGGASGGQDDLLQAVNSIIQRMKTDGSLRTLHEKYGLVYAY